MNHDSSAVAIDDENKCLIPAGKKYKFGSNESEQRGCYCIPTKHLTNQRRVACVVTIVVCSKIAIVLFLAMYWRQLLSIFMSVALSIRHQGRSGYVIVSLLTFISAFPPIPSTVANGCLLWCWFYSFPYLTILCVHHLFST